ncbi:hypothetical protein [Methanobrevibacter olleyae]|uniref:Uncharacterized protein n=1 Tax=Methanobrevibacter olleyae TaxID=294671 RepID=A0A126R1N6_METOL|nr:hypothetical protein [Methanobrevibacter olleyae]AMK15987.1 hypothetical protein YLM1_1430 [Methanobrevibacter olleyae]
MNPDMKKLMQILKNLERDYEAGLISEEKYIYLSDQYKHKIKTIEVSDRIRAMQGKEETHSSLNSKYNDSSDKNREEKEQLVRKYIHNPESYTVSSKTKESSSTSSWFIALAVVFLLVAFGAGIIFGMSSIGLEGDVTNMLTGSATINDTAFPEVKINKSLSFNYTKSYSNTTKYGSSSDDDSSSNSSRPSSDEDSGSSGSSSGSSGGGSSSGGSSSDSGSSGSSSGSSGGGSSSGGSSSDSGSSGSSGGGSSSGGSSSGGGSDE